MAEDVMIEFSVELGKALEDLKQLENQVKTMKSSIDNQVSPSVNTMGTRVTAAGNKIKGLGQNLKDKLGTEGALAFAAVGGAALNFSKQCVQSAMTAQQEWGRFNALLTQTGVSSEAAKKVQADVKGIAQEMHRTTADTREASLTFLQAGVSANQLTSALNAAGGVAARAGITQSEAASAISAALVGNSRQLKKLTGLRLEDYKKADGQIDKERLLNDLYNQNKGAIDQYANSTEAKMNDIQNAMGKFKSSIGEALLPVVSLLAQIASAVANFISGLPDGVKQFLAILLLVGGAIGSVIGVLGLFAGALVSIGEFIAAVGAAGGVVAWVSTTFPMLGAAIGFVTANLLPIIAVILAVVAAFYILYEVGKQMGWWNDLNGMIAKFGEVLGQVIGVLGEFASWFVKLFTDFPAAQAQFNDFINFLGGALMDGLNAAWQAISGAVGGLIDALSTMFWDGVNGAGGAISDALNGVVQWVNEGLSNWWNSFTGGASQLTSSLGQMFWDGVNGAGAAIMDALSGIGQIITDALSNLGASVVPGGGLTEGILAIVAPLPTLLYGVFQRLGPTVVPAIMGFINTVIQTFTSIGTGILNAFTMIPGLIIQALTGIVTVISTWLGQARMIAGMLVTMLVQSIVTRFNLIVARVRQIFMMVVNAIRSRLMNAVTIAGTLASRVRQMIVTRFNQIIARVRQIFQNIVNTIRQRLSNAVSAAKDKAREIYDGIKQKVSEIPQMVADEFNKIGDRIRDALNNAKNIAVSKISELVSAVKGALGIASPGYIQRMVTWEFNSLPGIIEDNGVVAARNAGDAARGIVTAWTSNMESLTLPMEDNFDMWSMGNVMSQAGLNMNAVTAPMTPVTPPGARPSGGLDMSTSNTTNDNATNIHVDKIELDCNNLTQQQSRQILYDALDGLYTGGV